MPPRKRRSTTMSPRINLDEVDVDGAIREAHEEAIDGLQEGDTRLTFLRKSAVTAGAAVSGGALLGTLAPAASAATGRGRAPPRLGQGGVGGRPLALPPP